MENPMHYETIYWTVINLNMSDIQARIQKFFNWGVEEYYFERNMFVDTHKNLDKDALFLSSFFSRGLSSIFSFVLLLSFLFEIWKGGCKPPNPPPRSANVI